MTAGPARLRAAPVSAPAMTRAQPAWLRVARAREWPKAVVPMEAAASWQRQSALREALQRATVPTRRQGPRRARTRRAARRAGTARPASSSGNRASQEQRPPAPSVPRVQATDWRGDSASGHRRADSFNQRRESRLAGSRFGGFARSRGPRSRARGTWSRGPQVRGWHEHVARGTSTSARRTFVGTLHPARSTQHVTQKILAACVRSQPIIDGRGAARSRLAAPERTMSGVIRWARSE